MRAITDPHPNPLPEGEVATVGEQFRTLDQEHETAQLGMWIFLATELMLFGGLFTAYAVYRTMYPEGFAEGSRQLDLLYAGPNTGVLLLSSLTMALGVHAAQTGRPRSTFWYLVVTALFGALFMAIKGAEYYKHFLDGTLPGMSWTITGPNAAAMQLFFVAYLVMTGLHAVHLIIGIAIVLVIAVLARRGAFLPALRHVPVEMVGLYWHFVDVIWTFLFPLLYLSGLHS